MERKKKKGGGAGGAGIQFLRAALENVHTPGPAETSPGSSDITLCSCMPWVTPPPPHPPSLRQTIFIFSAARKLADM